MEVKETAVHPRLLDYLPAIYQRSEECGRFLAAFEGTLFGAGSAEWAEDGLAATTKGLEPLIDGIPALFDAELTLPEFLPWLSQWASVTAHEGIPEARRRQLIAKMIPLYAIRGTKAYVEEALWLYLGVKAVVEEEDLPGMSAGIQATLGYDARLGADPFRFHVFLDFLSGPFIRSELPGLLELAHQVVNLAKPAHTRFRLTHNAVGRDEGMVISVHSTVGIDTYLWHD